MIVSMTNLKAPEISVSDHTVKRPGNNCLCSYSPGVFAVTGGFLRRSKHCTQSRVTQGLANFSDTFRQHAPPGRALAAG